MNRRKLLTIGGAGAAGLAGCAALKRTVLSDDDESAGDGNEPGNESSSTDTGEATSTDTSPKEREESDSEPPAQENETTQESNETEEQNTTDTPEGDPTDAVEITEHEMIFEEAADPNYESDELYIDATIRNTSEHDLQNVRVDGYAYADDVPVGHEYLEYAVLEAGGELSRPIHFYVDDPAAVERYKLEVTAAQWA